MLLILVAPKHFQKVYEQTQSFLNIPLSECWLLYKGKKDQKFKYQTKISVEGKLMINIACHYLCVNV